MGQWFKFKHKVQAPQNLSHAGHYLKADHRVSGVWEELSSSSFLAFSPTAGTDQRPRRSYLPTTLQTRTTSTTLCIPPLKTDTPPPPLSSCFLDDIYLKDKPLSLLDTLTASSPSLCEQICTEKSQEIITKQWICTFYFSKETVFTVFKIFSSFKGNKLCRNRSNWLKLAITALSCWAIATGWLHTHAIVQFWRDPCRFQRKGWHTGPHLHSCRCDVDAKFSEVKKWLLFFFTGSHVIVCLVDRLFFWCLQLSTVLRPGMSLTCTLLLLA